MRSVADGSTKTILSLFGKWFPPIVMYTVRSYMQFYASLLSLTSLQRQRLLDSACAPLRLKLFRMGATPMELGEASLQLSALIHDTASLDPGTCVGRGVWEGGGSQTGSPKLQWFSMVLSLVIGPDAWKFRGTAW